MAGHSGYALLAAQRISNGRRGKHPVYNGKARVVAEMKAADLSEGPLCRKCFMGRSMDNRTLTARCTAMAVWCDETQQWKHVYP